MLRVVVNAAAKEEKLEQAHAPSDDGQVLELVLEHDLDVPGAVGRACGLPDVPPVGVDLVVGDDDGRAARVGGQRSPAAVDRVPSVLSE